MLCSDLSGKEKSKKGGMYVNIQLIYFTIQQKLYSNIYNIVKHCKAMIFNKI